MKKTVILSKNKPQERITILEQIMRGAFASGFVISKDSIIFNSKKEAQEMLKNHPCGSGFFAYTLNPAQERFLYFIKKANTRALFIDITTFLKIK